MTRTASSRTQDDRTDRSETLPPGGRADTIEGWIETALAEQAERKRGRRKNAAAPEASAPGTVPDSADDALRTEAAASERRAGETAAKTAEALGSVAEWIERAQERLTETTEAAAKSQADTAAIVSEAVGSLGQRLSEIERKVTSTGPGGTEEALRAIERLETKLTEAKAPPPRPSFEDALRGFEARMAELSDRIGAPPRSFARRPLLAPEILPGAVAEIKAHQLLLERHPGPSAPADVLALGTGTATSQAALLASLQRDVSRLAGQMEAAKPAPYPDAETLRTEIEAVRSSLDRFATRDDLQRIELGVAGLSGDVSELRNSGGDPSAAAREIERLEALVRSVAAERPAGAGGALAREVEILAHKLDILAASGVDPTAAGSLAGEIREIRALLADAAPAEALAAVRSQLSGLEREVAEMRASAGGTGAARSGEAGAIDAMLVSVIDRLERVERHAADPEALDELERQVSVLARTVGERPGHDGATAALERSMTELLREVSGWRAEAEQVAQRAARAAVDEALGSGPRPAEIQREVSALRARCDLAEERAAQQLAEVSAALNEAVERIATLEDGRSDGTERAAPPPRLAAVAEGEAERPSEAVASRTAPPFAGPTLTEADRPLPAAPEDEVLLEPGAARPGTGGQPGADAPALDPADIKSSFIAAVRRAQAAQAAAEAAGGRKAGSEKAGAGSAPEGKTSSLLGRIQTMVEARRRPLLMSAAALVLGIGTLQLARTLTEPTDGTVSAALPAPTAIAAAEVPSRLAAPLPAEAGKEPADPATTQGIPSSPAARSFPGAESAPEAVRTAAAAIPPAEPAKAPGTETASRSESPAPAASPPPAAIASRPAPDADAGALPPGLKAAAATGDPAALYELAARTAEGRGVPRDAHAAAILFEKAAEKGLAPAQYRTGNLYEKGVGVPRDLEAAKLWYRRAAEGGNIRAMHNLAVLIAEGSAGKPDYAAAASWFGRAADAGIRDSQFNLAVLHARGLGMPQDFTKAYTWLAVAALSGDADAARKRDEVAGRLTPLELARAKAVVERWKPTPPSPEANEVKAPAGGWPEPSAKRTGKDSRA